MSLPMAVYCGTCNPIHFTIDLDDYCTIDLDDYCTYVEASNDRTLRTMAYRELKKVLGSGRDFANDGHRNNDAVNSCIALHVLGYDPVVWFDAFFNEHTDGKFYGIDVEKFKEHVNRVCNYLDVWGPDGNRGDALNYLI